MGEFSIEFYFDLQRFASFNGGTFGGSGNDEETGILSSLFDNAGNAKIKPNSAAAKIYDGEADGNTFWNSAAIISLTPKGANASVGGAVSIVSGAYNSLTLGGGNSIATMVGYAISSVGAVDVQNAGDVAFGTIGNVTILNPNGTVTIGSNAVDFSGDGIGSSTHDSALDWDVGTKISVNGGQIANATMAAGEVVTTANGLSAAFTNGGTATFANKSFGTIDAFSSGSTAGLSVIGNYSSLQAVETSNGVADSVSAITAVYSGASLQSVKFNGKEADILGSISFGGRYNVGRDISIQGGVVNVGGIKGDESTITYNVNSDVGDTVPHSVLDVTQVVPTSSTYRISVSGAGKAEYLMASDFLQDTVDSDGNAVYRMTTINIGGVNYQFNDVDASNPDGAADGSPQGNGGIFEITDGKVTGFVFRDEGDSITIPMGTDLTKFNLYKATNASNAADNEQFGGLEKISFNISGSNTDYVITKAADSASGQEQYEIEIYDGASLEITNDDGSSSVAMEVTLPKYQGNKGAAKIVVNADGQITGITTVVKDSDGAVVDTGDQPVGGTVVSITESTGDALAEGTTVNGVQVNVASGTFEFVAEGKAGQLGVKSIQLTSADETIEEPVVEVITDPDTGEVTGYGDPVKVKPYEGTEGKVTYLTNQYTFTNADGNAYLYADEDSLRFVFVDAGDAITIPESVSNTTELFYLDKNNLDTDNLPTETTLSTVPVVTGGDYTIEMTTATKANSAKAEFELKGLAEGSRVQVGTETTTTETDETEGTTTTTTTIEVSDTAPTFTYSAAGGTFLFGQEGDVSTVNGFTAASGTVTMDANAAALLGTTDGSAAAANNGRPTFKIDGTAVLINTTIDDTYTYDGKELVYTKSENSLLGLAPGSVIRDAGGLTKIYAPNLVGEFQFGNIDSTRESDYQTFTAYGADGGADDTDSRAYFTVEGTKATGFTFIAEGDQLTAADFSTLTLTDGPTFSDFSAPVVTDANDAAAAASIIKARETFGGTTQDCYQLQGADENSRLNGLTATFDDESSISFNDTGTLQETVYFNTKGALLAINGLYDAGDSVTIDNAKGAVFIDDATVEITGGGFTYTMMEGNLPEITDLKAGSNVIQAANVPQIRTIAGASGIGDFTFGASDSAKTFSVSAATATDNDGVLFKIGDNLTISGISEITGTESVTGALANLALNNTTVAITEATEGYDGYTFSGNSFAGLQAGDKVTDAGSVTDLITADNGDFEILGSSIAIAGDSAVVFNVADGALTGIQQLSGTATTDFQEELAVNDESIKVTGDDSVAVSGDDSVVTAISNIGGGSIALEQIGSASLVSTDADGTFDFVEGKQTFTTAGTSDGVSFGIEDKKVTSITGVDNGEMVTGNFSGDGVSVDGALVQVENNGVDITYVNGSHSGMTGTGIYGLQDGASVVSASGIDVAVAVGQSGTYTFGEQQFTIANDSNNHVGFLLDNGKVTGIFDVDGEVSGNLNGITINQQAPDIEVRNADGFNTDLTYSNGLLTGIKDGDTVVSADNVSTVRAAEGGTFTFGSQSFTVTDDADGVDFIVTKGTTDVVGVDGLDKGATLEGALNSLNTINGKEFEIQNDNDFGVVGAGESAGISEIFDLSDTAVVVNSGGASKAITNTKGKFTFGGLSGSVFDVASDEYVEFSLDKDTGKVTAIDGLSGAVTAESSDDFKGVTVNQKSFSINGDQDDLAVVGTDDEQGIKGFEKVGGDRVMIEDADGAEYVTTDKVGSVNFTKSMQTFSTNDDDKIKFTIENDKVTTIDELTGTAIGGFEEITTINGEHFNVNNKGYTLSVTGSGSGVSQIANVVDGAEINDVAQATKVVTEGAGTFKFSGHTTPFTVTGKGITFDVADEGYDITTVKGISDLDEDEEIEGELNGLTVNGGKSISVDGDDDNQLSYKRTSTGATLGKVGGSNVTVRDAAQASKVELDKDGSYTLGDKTYDIAAGNSATLGVDDNLAVTAVDGIDGKDEYVEGDFTTPIAVNGQSVQVLGDSSIVVKNDGDELVIEDLKDGATIEKADDIYKAKTEEDPNGGTFADTTGKEISIGNGGASIALDGSAKIVGVSGVTGGISGDISDITINGESSALISVVSAATGELNPNLTLKDGVLGGVIPGDTVYSAGSAEVVQVTGSGQFTFTTGGTSGTSQVFTLNGDSTASVLFDVVNGSSVTAVNEVGENETIYGAFNGSIPVNGQSVSIRGDQGDIGIVGDVNNEIGQVVNVGGGSNGVTIMSAGGAASIVTDTEGQFTFNASSQKFTVGGDTSVAFGIDPDEKVTAIGDLNGTVAGDFSEEIVVNGKNVQVSNDKDGVSVVGSEDTPVTEILDVDAGATVDSSGGASIIRTAGEGVYTFAESGDKFTITGDAAINFNLDNGDVVGVDSFTKTGNDRALITFDASNSPALEINPDVNDIVEVSASGSAPVTIEVDSAGKIIGVGGVSSVSGLDSATIAATGPMTINGNAIDIIDAEQSQYNIVLADGEVEKVTGVTGPATVNVADASVEADRDGVFQINGQVYTIVDEDDSFGITTDPNKNLSSVTSLKGAIVIEDGVDEFAVNGNDLSVINNTAVTISTDGTSITAVDGLNSGATIDGALDNASIAMAPNAVLTVNDTVFALMGATAYGTDISHDGYYWYDTDGVTLNGKGEIVGLDDGARMSVTAAGNYTVNGSVIEGLVPGDTIIGAGSEGAYVYDPDNVLVREYTPISTIESLTGIPNTVNAIWGTATTPVTKDVLDSVLADSTWDKNLAIEMYTTNPNEKVEQDIDLSPYKFTKKVHLFDGDQNVSLNSEGGNLVHVEGVQRTEEGAVDHATSGKKKVVLGDGEGDVVVVDQSHDISNSVSIVGGTGDDSIFVRNSVETTINMSEGGADKVVTFAGANARIALEGYNASTGAGVQFDQLSLRDAEGGIANAIEKGIVNFGDGVVSLHTNAGTTEVSLNGATGGTNSLGGSVVNLFTPEGTRQQVGFTHSAGGLASVDSSSTEDVIFIGNKDGNKEVGSTLLGGRGNDVAFAGEHDLVDMGDGLNIIRLQDDMNREGAFVNLSAGVNQIYGTNSTLDEIHGDTLGVDLTQTELSYVDGNLVIQSKEGAATQILATVVGADKDLTLSYDTAADLAESADLATSADDSDTTTGGTSSATTEDSSIAAAVISSLAPDHNYTNQIFNSNGTVIQAAIGATGSVIDVKLDEDVRADYYVGDDSGLTFYGYNGDVLVDLEGDWQASRIDTANVTLQGITSVAAGTGLNYIKGSDNNETFFAGRGNSHLYGDGGRNLLVGYEGADKEGQTTFYLLGNAYDAANTISGFDFVDDDNYTNNNRITADKLEVDLPTNYVNRVELSNDDVVVNVTGRNGINTESAVIVGAKGKDILVSGDGIVADVVAQIGDDTLTFDKFANYYNATGKNATVVVDQNNQMDYARVWLDNASLTGTTFVGDIHEINASLYAGAAELAGNDYNNTIIAGSGATSLWGGNKGDDALVAGTGQDRFFYTIGNGTDTIYGAKDGDIVDLAGVKLSDIVGADFSEIGVALNFRDGGKLYIGDNGGNDVSYVVEGQTYFVNENHNGFERKQ